ncbi:MAG: hypothetical protein ABW061_11705 [Polyangiaceae bacterium]
MSSACADIRQSAEQFGETQRSLVIWADELTPEIENLKQSAIGLQAEAVRAAMYAQSLRAASERLSIVSQLLTDEGGAS